MRIRLGTLRKVIKEVAISPGVFKNTQTVREPTDNPNVAKLVQEFEQKFVSALKLNLVVANADKYNEETREFDDAAYGRVEEALKGAKEAIAGKVVGTLNDIWVKAHQHVKGAAAQQEKPQQKQPSAGVTS